MDVIYILNRNHILHTNISNLFSEIKKQFSNTKTEKKTIKFEKRSLFFFTFSKFTILKLGFKLYTYSTHTKCTKVLIITILTTYTISLYICLFLLFHKCQSKFTFSNN